MGSELLLTLAASTLGSAIDIAVKYLAEDQPYKLDTIVPLATAFKWTPGPPVSSDWDVNCLVINVGPEPLVVERGKTKFEDVWKDKTAGSAYAKSPVVVALRFAPREPQSDPAGTAITARVEHWKYARFVDPKTHWFRDPERAVSIEVEFKTPDATSLLKVSLTAQADEAHIGSVRPRNGEPLPWMKRPTMNYPSTAPAPTTATSFGPINMTATLTEIAKATWFGKILSGSLAAEKTAILEQVKQKLKEDLGSGEKAKAKLAVANAAVAALTAYDAAYTAASTARSTYDAGKTPGTWGAFNTKFAVLRQQEVLTREAFDQAGLPFQAYPAISSSP